MKGQNYTYTAPMGRTACTEPQCLYKGDLYLTFIPFIKKKANTVESRHYRTVFSAGLIKASVVTSYPGYFLHFIT
jgi:hypothetical protein